MSNVQKEEKGAKGAFRAKSAELLIRLKTAMAEKDLGLRDLAQMTGLSYPHVVALMAGDRWWAGSERPVIEVLAKLLSVPVIQVYFWAGFLEPQDQMFEHDLKERLQLTYRKMTDDPYVMSVVPPPEDWKKTPISSKISIVMLYEALANNQLNEHAKLELSDKQLKDLGIGRSPASAKRR